MNAEIKSYLKSRVIFAVSFFVALLGEQTLATYCSASGGCDEYIYQVQVGTINNNGTGCSMYADYTSTYSTIMETGVGYQITIVTAVNGVPYQGYDGDQLGIWVDWNGDEDFYDAGETVYTTSGYGLITITITPPIGTFSGNKRMRIRLTWMGALSSCGATDFGEVEDYTINVVSTKMKLSPVADSYVSPDYPNTNYGTETKLIEGKKNNAKYFTYLKFDLSSIPSGNAIFSAKLHLYAYEVGTYAPSAQAKFISDDSWQETEITGANAPSMPGGTTTTVPIVSGDNVFDVSVDVDRSYITDGIYSVAFSYLYSSENEYYAYFASREYSTPGLRPYLEIEYDEPFCGGTGSDDDPYQICTGEQMNNIGRLSSRWTKNYKLMADISLSAYSGSSYNIIGRSSSTTNGSGPFTGTFDGNYHSISGFSYSASSINYVGIFGYVGSAGTIKNLKIISPSLTDAGFDDMTYVGPIAGYASGSNIFGCAVTGGTVQGTNYVGGLVGLSSGYIASCRSSASVSGGNYIGGLVGGQSGLGALSGISDCYARGNVSGTSYIGGFIGNSSDVVVVNSYSTGTVNGTSNVGGFSGYNVNQYISGNVTGCFWDTISSGMSTSAAGTGLGTPAMQNITTFLNAGWDFAGETDNGGSDVWAMPAGGGYPVLWYELPVPPALPSFAGGSGTVENPYLIATKEQLNSIGHNARLMDKHFRLISDLDFNGVKYYMIAEKPYIFSGTFEGANHTISNILVEPVFKLSSVGLVGTLMGQDASIRNLKLIDPNIVSDLGSGVGSLVGKNLNGTITNCHAVNTHVLGLSTVGGLVGSNYSHGNISDCSATGYVSENTSMPTLLSAVGGLVGENIYWSEIKNSFAKCDVFGNDCVGGLAGSNLIYGELTNCYADGSVTGTSDYIGGLIGRNLSGTHTDYCYSSVVVTGPTGTNAVGGFVGKMGTSGGEFYKSCFWDSEINSALPGIGNGTDPNVIGETTANMQTENTFASKGWDFIGESANGTEDIWRMCMDGITYPKLACEFVQGDFLCPDGVDFLDFAFFAGHWLLTNCGLSNNCNGADFDISGTVNSNDLKIFADQWLD
jgi:hypothetical protein